MTVVLGLLILLIAGAPVWAFGDVTIIQQLLLLTIALMFALAAVAAPAFEINRALKLSRPFLLWILLVVAWAILQAAPIPLNSFDHPIWRSAAAALNEPISGHVSLDLGATLRILFECLGIVALAMVNLLLAQDRGRAETILVTLGAVTALMAAELLLVRLEYLPSAIIESSGIPDALIGATALGAILNAAAMIRVVERNQSRREQFQQHFWVSAGAFALFATGAAFCLFALIQARATNVALLTSFGLTILFLVFVVRHFDLGLWPVIALSASAIVIATGIAIIYSETNSSLPLTLRYATSASASAIAATQRMIADTSWLGNGAGTFSTLAGIYQDFGTTPALTPPSAVSKTVIEWGWPVSLAFLTAAAQLFVTFLRGALQRGRDSFFPAAAAASVLVLAGEAYCDASLASTTVQLLAAVIIGLGVSQSAGRTSRK